METDNQKTGELAAVSSTRLLCLMPGTLSDGERVLLARKRKKLAAWKCAANADCDPTTFSRIERDEREATYEQKQRIARALGLDPIELFKHPHK